jgi:hypothetical protein
VVELLFWFRSQGMTWPLRVGDKAILRRGEERLEFPAELVLEILSHYFQMIELQGHMAHGTLPRWTLMPRRVPDMVEQRRLERRSRRKP